MYELYLVWLAKEAADQEETGSSNYTPVSLTIYRKICHIMDIHFGTPARDSCPTCDTFQAITNPTLAQIESNDEHLLVADMAEWRGAEWLKS